MTSEEFAVLVSNNCSVMGADPTEDEKRIYRELYEQDLKEGIPVLKMGLLLKLKDFF